MAIKFGRAFVIMTEEAGNLPEIDASLGHPSPGRVSERVRRDARAIDDPVLGVAPWLPEASSSGTLRLGTRLPARTAAAAK